MSNIQLANNLKYLRDKHHLTQDDMHNILNVSRQAYSNYERGERTPDLDTLLHIASYYHLTLDALVLHNLQEVSALTDRIGEDRTPYILTKEKETGNSLYLSQEEMNLITKFRSLSRHTKEILTGFLANAE